MKGKKIVIAGASGFVGRHFIERFSQDYNLIGLTRAEGMESDFSVEWRSVDHFSISSTQNAIEGADIAIYLIHSMGAQSKLTQANFADTDLVLADNFARACAHHNVKQIIYVSGIVPQGSKELSPHLKSRYEVERALGAYGTPVTTLRCGMVVGPEGPSFRILTNLTRKLPAMILPKWTQSKTEIITISDLLNVFKKVIGNQAFFSKSVDVTNGKTITYAKLIKEMAYVMNKTTLMVGVPINSTSFSKLWVKYFGEADYTLVSPLIDSLVHDIVSGESFKTIEDCIEEFNLREVLVKYNKKDLTKKKFRRTKNSSNENNVRSIQRYVGLKDMSAKDLSQAYIKFLPQFFKYFIHAHITEKWDDKQRVGFYVPGLNEPILELTYIEERSDETRHLFYITGGALVKRTNHGWLEFRQLLDREITLAAIHEFVPSLPWSIYKVTQAPLHSFVMNRFYHYLSNHKFE